MNLDKDILKTAMILHIMNRGTGEVIEESETGIFIYDFLAESYVLLNDDIEQGIEWFKAHEDRDYEVMAVYGEAAVDIVKARGIFPVEERCYQAVWMKDSAPELDGVIEFRPADERDRRLLLDNYDYAANSDEYYDTLVQEERLYIGEVNGERVGFIGTHPEGSMGILEIMPEFRRNGYAMEMEKFLIGKILEDGGIPHGHVFIDNEKSMALQRKLGFEFWDGIMSWFHY